MDSFIRPGVPLAEHRMADLTEEKARLAQKRSATFEGMKKIADRAERESRDIRPDEMKQYRKLESEFDGLDSEVEQLARVIERKIAERHDGKSRGAGSPLPGWHDTDGTIRRSGSTVTERTVVLGREQRMADWASVRDDDSEFTAADADEFSLGNIMRALVEPGFRTKLSDVEQRALAVGVDAQGGFITPEILSSQFIDKVRNAMQVIAAGAVTVPLDSDKQSIPRISADPVGAWRNENAAFALSQPAFERVTFTPQGYGFIVQTSEELYQDAIEGSGGIIENAIVQTAALELDRAAIRGSGTAPEPRGVRNQSGVTIQSLGVNGATPTRYNEIMTAITTLLNANRQPTGWLMAPRTSQFYAGLIDTTNQPLAPPQPVAELDRFVTAQVPVNITQGTSTDTSEVYVADWRDLLIGIRLGIQLRLLTERYADNGQYAWRVFLRADVQLAHPESFVVLTGVRP